MMHQEREGTEGVDDHEGHRSTEVMSKFSSLFSQTRAPATNECSRGASGEKGRESEVMMAEYKVKGLKRHVAEILHHSFQLPRLG